MNRRIVAPGLAIRPEAERDFLIQALLRCYAVDADFRAALVALHQEHRELLPHIGPPIYGPNWNSLAFLTKETDTATHPDAPLVRAVQHFASEWQLDCFPACIGQDAILAAVRDTPLRPALFGFYAAMHPIPHISAVPLDMRPWHPQSETEAEYLQEMLQRAKEHTAAVRVAYEAAGYHLPDVEPMTATYVQWTYRRYVKREHFDDIAQAEPEAKRPSPRTVQQRTVEVANAVGFSLPRTRRRGEDLSYPKHTTNIAVKLRS